MQQRKSLLLMILVHTLFAVVITNAEARSIMVTGEAELKVVPDEIVQVSFELKSGK